MALMASLSQVAQRSFSGIEATSMELFVRQHQRAKGIHAWKTYRASSREAASSLAAILQKF